jgi:hypothetical protein
MHRWVAVSLLVVSLAWGPYLYSELSRRGARSAAPRAEAGFLPSESQLSAAKAAEPLPPAKLVKAPRPLQPSAAEEAEAPVAMHAAETTAPRTAVLQAPARDDPEARVRAFHKLFDEEPRDAFWANDQELGLRKLVQELEVPAEDIGEVACRRTVCRLVLAQERWTDQDSQVLARLRKDFGAALLDERDGDERATLYVLRAGYAEAAR